MCFVSGCGVGYGLSPLYFLIIFPFETESNIITLKILFPRIFNYITHVHLIFIPTYAEGFMS